MDKISKRKIKLLQDINKVIKAIDDEVDTFIVSRMHSNLKIGNIANEAFERKKENTIRIAKAISQKYDRHN